ncbi:MAG: hypothetical protein Q8O52_18380 [Sulfuritalea sp.]|nr:hypothetical protein [Sulfuritalea sp.]
MPKPVATTIVRCPMPIGRFCAVLSALILPPPAVAATPDPALRRSEQLDIRRLGKVSEDERSVLRIEWRVALTGAEETRSVQDMLDNLRRIEQTMSAVNLLVRNMPAPKPVTAVAAEPAASDDNGTRLMLANIAAACLVALWWFRRRKSAEPSAPKAAGTLEESPSVAAPSVAALPTRVPSIATGSAKAQPAPIVPAVKHPEAERIEPRVPTEAIAATSAPTPNAPPKVEPGASPTSAASEPSAPLPAAESAIVDFSLEDDPEGEARAKARMPVPRSKDRDTRVPERRQEIDVEPTLQLAEIMLSMGLEQGAAQALVEYTEANPRAALHHWLKLLGIYRKRGLNKEFAETAGKLRQHFNIQAEYSAKTDTGETPTLEKFSRVAEHVQKIWLRPEECIDYLQRLLEDNREGARAGFPQSVAEEILLLVEILKQISGSDQTAGT